MNTLKSKKKIDFSVLSSSRLELMGFAALWIIFHHMYELDFSAAHPSTIGNIIFTLFSVIKPAGNVGVEIFLICSGFGLYYSFSKNSNILSFYKKRAIRILPAVLIVSSIYYAFANIGIREYFSSVLLIDYFTKGKTDFWYFALLISLYILYPLIHKLVEKQKDSVVIGVVVFLIALGFVMAYILKLDLGIRYYAILRVPSFIIGVWFGKKSFEKKQFGFIWIPICMAVAVFCFALVSAMHFNRIPMSFTNSVYLYYFINIPFSVSISVIFAVLFNRLSLRIVKASLALCGTLSLELYLLFERVTEICKVTINLHDLTNISFYVAATAITFALALILQAICKNFTSEFTKYYKKLK